MNGSVVRRAGMAFARTVTQLTCPDRRHRHSQVWGFGTYERGDDTFQRYRCVPLVGAKHTFSVLRDGDGTPRLVGPWQPAAGKPLRRPIIWVADELQLSRASDSLASVAGWTRCWNTLDRLMPGKKWIKSQRAYYESA
jgi:hypothetical protein